MAASMGFLGGMRAVLRQNLGMYQYLSKTTLQTIRKYSLGSFTTRRSAIPALARKSAPDIHCHGAPK